MSWVFYLRISLSSIHRTTSRCHIWSLLLGLLPDFQLIVSITQCFSILCHASYYTGHIFFTISHKHTDMMCLFIYPCNKDLSCLFCAWYWDYNGERNRYSPCPLEEFYWGGQLIQWVTSKNYNLGFVSWSMVLGGQVKKIAKYSLRNQGSSPGKQGF